MRLQLNWLAVAGFAVGLGAPVPATAQACSSHLEGAWTGSLPASALLQVRLSIREYRGALTGEIRTSENTALTAVWSDGAYLRLQSTAHPIAFEGRFSADSTAIVGFVTDASTITHIELPRDRAAPVPTWTTEWNLLGVPEERFRFDLYVEAEDDGPLGGYFFFRDPRLPGLWGYGAVCSGDSLTTREKTLRLTFSSRLDASGNRLMTHATGPAGSAPMSFDRMSPADIPSSGDAPDIPARTAGNRIYAPHAPSRTDDGWDTAAPSALGFDTGVLARMVAAIADGAYPNTHSILVARRGQLVVEEYFYGFDRDTWHDMRSASKSVTSTLIGLAIQEGYIPDASATALSFLPQYRRYAAWDDRKAAITIRDLLTMSSGLDANDSDRHSMAAEGAYQSQTARPDWIKLALDAPMVADPGTHVVYGGANPMILGGILAAVLPEPVAWFADRTLFAPLGIARYKFSLDPTGIPYMGGGLYLRPRDMLKYGQLYLNGGTWEGRRILSPEWIAESWETYGRLEPLDRNGHEYGYLWWHHHYAVGDQTVQTLEARGNGGQYIFVIPDLEMVVVITAGNFRGGLTMTRQPEEILRQYLLPAARP